MNIIKALVLAILVTVLLATKPTCWGQEVAQNLLTGSAELGTSREALIFRLPFDGGFEAASSRGNPTAQMSGDVQLVQGRKDQAGSFTDNANLVFDAEGNFDWNEGTLALWIRPYWPENDRIPHCFLHIPLAGTAGLVVTKGWSNSNHPDLSYFYHCDYHYSTMPIGFEANEWIHIAFSWSVANKELRLYRKGQLVRMIPVPNMGARPAATGRHLVIGARLGGTYGADADIDELMIFNRPLSDTEVARLAGTKVQPRPGAVEEQWDAAHINQVEMGPETPHLTFNRPSALGTVRVLFIVPYLIGARDIVELAQRCDVDFTVVTARDPDRLGWDGAYYKLWKALATEDKIREALTRLDKEPHVIVVGNINFSRLPGEVRDKIMSLINPGTGLVVTFPRALSGKLLETTVPGARSETVSGVPLVGMDECFADEELAVDELVNKVVGTYQYGQGRVVTISFEAEPPAQRPNCDGWEGLAPGAMGGRWTRQFEHRHNYYLSLVGKAIQWAAKRSPRATWTDLPLRGQSLQRAQLPLSDQPIVVKWTGRANQSMTFQATLRDPLGHVESQSRQQIVLGPGRNSTSIPLPKLKCGRHYVDLVLAARGEVENWASIAFDVEGPEEIIELRTEREHYERGETVQGSVQFQDRLPAAAQLEIRAVDTWEHVYDRVTVSVPAGTRDAGFQIAVDRPTTLATYIEVDVVRGGEVLSQADTVVFVPKRKFKDFVNSIWCGIWNEGIGQVALRQLRKAGFNAVYHCTNSLDFHNDAMADMMPAQYLTRLTLYADSRGWATRLGAGNWNVVPEDSSFANPEVQEQLRATAADVREVARLGPVYYTLGDENFYRGDWGYSPYGIEFFHDFLRKRYGAIEHLNEEYGSDCSDFDAVPRYQAAQALGEGLIPAYLDHYLAQDKEWAAYHHLLAEEIRRNYDPKARVGAEGSECQGYERMVEGLQLWSPSVGIQERVLLRSLVRPEFLRSSWWGGYHDGARDATSLWDGLLRGFKNLQIFFQAVWVEGCLNPDFSYRAFLERILPELQEIYSGPALLLAGAELVNADAMAMHYSRTSELAGKYFRKLGTAVTTAESVGTSLFHLNRDFRYISGKQMVGGKLDSPRGQVLFLPGSYALSQAEAKTIEEFVRTGGTVVAVLPPGALNEFGRRLPAGQLDQVFGASCRGKTAPVPVRDLTIDTELDGLPLRLCSSRAVVESALAAQGAQVLARAGDTPVLLVHNYGQGQALLLNLDISFCSKSMRAPFINSVLQVAGVEPLCRLDGPPKAQLSVLRRGAVTLIGVVLPANSERGAALSWSKLAHVYDVRAGAYLGRRNELAVQAPPEGRRVHLFALQSEPVSNVTVKAREEIERGKTLRLRVHLEAGTVDPTNRLMRIDVISPNGELVKHYRDFVTLKGHRGRSAIPFAFNDLPGQWTIRATDVASGVTGTTMVTLR